MTPEDRIRPSVESALNELTARVDKDVRAIVQQLLSSALEEREAALAGAREAALNDAAVDTRRQVAEVEARSQAQRREAEQAAIRQLVESVRSLDAATTLSDVLDALAVAVRHQAARAAVLVIRQDRLVGWKLAGFGASDAQPRTVDFGLTEGDVVGVAVQAGRTVSTGENGARSPAFAGLSPSRSGLAMPVTVGGRVVAVVYADGNGGDAPPPDVSTTWSERLELLTRHAARCLEALTVQKTVSAAAPRFWMQTPGRAGVTA